MSTERQAIRGRGVASNPANRFERIDVVVDEYCEAPDASRPATAFFSDASRSIIAFNDSPDVGFDASINPYRGCEHGCAYCYARPTHEYLGWSAGLDFETKILVKRDAPGLLRKALAAKSWKPQLLGLSGVTDPYQPIERKLRVTRGCLEVLVEFRNPVGIVTKNHLVTRDIDLLVALAEHQAVRVSVSITTLDGDLARVMEPRTSHPDRRLAAVRALADAGVPVGVLVAPIIPGLNDHEIPAIVAAAADAGAAHAGKVLLRLPHGVEPLFVTWLDTHFPNRKEKVLNRLRDMHGGRLKETQFHARMRGKGVFAEQINGLFKMACRKAGLRTDMRPLSTAAFRRPGDGQLELF